MAWVIPLCFCLLSERPNLYNIFTSRNSTFQNSCNVEKFKMLVCPLNPTDCKLVIRFLQKQFSDRDSLDIGDSGVLALWRAEADFPNRNSWLCTRVTNIKTEDFTTHLFNLGNRISFILWIFSFLFNLVHYLTITCHQYPSPCVDYWIIYIFVCQPPNIATLYIASVYSNKHYTIWHLLTNC